MIAKQTVVSSRTGPKAVGQYLGCAAEQRLHGQEEGGCLEREAAEHKKDEINLVLKKKVAPWSKESSFHVFHLENQRKAKS